jgi:hypothetical protein
LIHGFRCELARPVETGGKIFRAIEAFNPLKYQVDLAFYERYIKFALFSFLKRCLYEKV